MNGIKSKICNVDSGTDCSEGVANLIGSVVPPLVHGQKRYVPLSGDSGKWAPGEAQSELTLDKWQFMRSTSEKGVPLLSG